jgi:phospholipid-binding lipoprotein MlaA
MPVTGIAASLALAAATAAPVSPGVAAPPVAPAVTVPAAAPAAEAAEPDVDVSDDLPSDPAVAKPPPAADATPAAPSDDFTIASFDGAAPRTFPDPLEDLNRISYAISQPVDKFVLRPLAMTYKAVVPKPARDGARNIIGNATEPVVFINDILQLRPDRALRTLGRFLVNSAIGVFGLFDIAKRKPFNLPHRNNTFGNTLGYYGIGPIAYFYLPVLGPTTLRDSAAQFGDAYVRDPLVDKVLFPNSGRRIFKDSPQLSTAGTV